MMLYVCTKFPENISISFIERTQFETDRQSQKDSQTTMGKTMSPPHLLRGDGMMNKYQSRLDIMYKVPNCDLVPA